MTTPDTAPRADSPTLDTLDSSGEDSATSDASDSGGADTTDTSTVDTADAADTNPRDTAVTDSRLDAPVETGTGCASNADCASNQFCDAPSCGGTGTCANKPGIGVFCRLDANPSCGCDGTEYTSACAAHKAGVRVAHYGACSAAPCNATSDCASLGSGYVCSFGEGNCTAPGFCKTSTLCPGFLTAYCSCAGTDVSTNTCLADRGGERLAHSGACP